jgi:hypothetical protein
MQRMTPGAGLLAGLGLFCALFSAGAVSAADGAPPPVRDEPGVVHVPGTRNPEMRTYRGIADALDAFDEHRRLAPAAMLQFRFMHNGGGPAGEDDGLALKLVGDDLSIPIPIDADGRFVIARSQAAYDADASFILNRKSGLFSYRPDIRTPGLPENVRRLGDLRLECYVMSAALKEKLPFWVRALVTTALHTPDWCGTEKASVGGYPAYGRLAQVTIREGGREEALPFEGANYSAPIGPGKFSDDALIEFHYVPGHGASPPAEQATAP